MPDYRILYTVLYQGVTTIEARDESEARARFAKGDWTLEGHEEETDDPPAIYGIEWSKMMTLRAERSRNECRRTVGVTLVP